MDFNLRCNSLKCRTQLTERAVVTTCSHIFCLACSNELGLSRPDGQVRICPACDTQLPNPDDAVETRLNPSEDYKTSVLSGLSPTIIMECAGRGLAFYTYQTTQEIMYNEFLAKSLTEKYSDLNAQMDKVVHDANAEIGSLRDKMQVVYQEKKRLEEENLKMAEAYREKAKSQANLQRLYNQLKAQVLTGQVAMAASEDAEATLQSVTGERFVDKVGGPPGPAGIYPAHEAGSGMNSRQRSNAYSGNGQSWRPTQGQNAWTNQGQAGRSLRQTASVNATPSQHRTRLGDPNVHPSPFRGSGFGHSGNTPMARQPLGAINPNSFSGTGTGGYGMSAGMRAGKQVNTSLGDARGSWPGTGSIRVPGTRQNMGMH
ncbi:cyclin [Phyllosticta citribraziliensis]|uniref:Cyclin n=1 Tax=Phyllosticta citribraziliensis TaxID=989973 RepID=A0ABR1LS36_9PEZI